ncbi:hypothetical protein PIROE2DRAFT_17662, partial [Piromyces sp. E2]
LCVRDTDNGYCAFDIYKKYLLASHNGTNSINSYIDLCDVCLIDMATEFQNTSQDEEAKLEMRTLSDMCKVKLFMDSYISDGEHKDDSEIISTLASLIPIEKSKLKRHFGKIHSIKKPEGVNKPNGKIKYGHVGINEKVNTSIHNKYRAQKRGGGGEEGDTEEDMIMMDTIKTKIASALTDIKELALQKVSTIFSDLEINVSVILEDDLFISDPEATREKNVITDDILSNIKDILNSDVSDLAQEIEDTIIAEEEEEEKTSTVSSESELESELESGVKEFTFVEEVEEIDEGEEADEETEEEEVKEKETEVVEEKETEEIPTTNINFIEDIFQEIINVLIPPNSNSNSNSKTKKSDNGEIFKIPDELNQSIVSVINEESTETAVAQESYPEIPTDGYPITDTSGSGIEGDDEIEEIEGILSDESSDIETTESVEVEGNGGGEGKGKIMDAGPHHGLTPVVKPEIPVITPGKPQRPHKSWKFGWKSKQNQVHNEDHKKKPTVLQAINKLFEEGKYTPSTPEEASQLYVPYKKWIVKKSEYVVSQELLHDDINPEPMEVEEFSVQNGGSFIPEPIYEEEEGREEKSIKLNNLENHRDNNGDEESFEIGSKKVSFINSVHPTKPSINFRDSEKRESKF